MAGHPDRQRAAGTLGPWEGSGSKAGLHEAQHFSSGEASAVKKGSEGRGWRKRKQERAPGVPRGGANKGVGGPRQSRDRGNSGT